MLIMVDIFGYAIDNATRLSFFLHLGTVFSAILYFRKDVVKILGNLNGYRPNFKEDNKLISFLLISTIISGGLGFVIFRYTADLLISGEFLLGLIGVALIITGLVQKFSKQVGVKSTSNLSMRDSVLLGIVQAFSAIPGLSRSGITVSTFLFRGYSGNESLRLSFLMGIPAILGAQAGLIALEGLPELDFTNLGLALLFSFGFGYASISFLIKISNRIPFWLFTITIGSVALVSFLGIF